MSDLLKQLNKARRESAEDTIAARLEELGFLGLRPRAHERASEAEKSLADIKADITATLEEVKAHFRANAKEAPEPSAAPQEEPSAAPQEEPVPPPQEEPVPPPQEMVTPACHPQLLKAFGILMRRVGAPPEEGAPGPVQKAVKGLAEVLAEGSEVSVENFFDRAYMADVTARRAKLEAKITRGDRPTKRGK